MPEKGKKGEEWPASFLDLFTGSTWSNLSHSNGNRDKEDQDRTSENRFGQQIKSKVHFRHPILFESDIKLVCKVQWPDKLDNLSLVHVESYSVVNHTNSSVEITLESS